MDEFNNMNLDELLSVSIDDSSNTMTGKLFTEADVDITIKEASDVEEVKKEEDTEDNRKLAMDKLAEYEELENKATKLDAELSLLNQELDTLISKIKLDNKELLDKINNISLDIENTKKAQDKVKEELLPLQRQVYLVNSEDKTLKFNKIQSTYVAPTEKNKFDLKKFREEQTDFWTENLAIFKPYAEITEVSDYLKITISKK